MTRPQAEQSEDAQATGDDSPWRVFIAGGSGLLGTRLVPVLIASGHEVAAMTRTPDKANTLDGLGATPVICDVFDSTRSPKLSNSSRPSVLIHCLTHLPDDRTQRTAYGRQHMRTLREGTRNVVAAAQRAGVSKLIAQSIAWEISGEGGAAYAALERQVLAADGVVLRFGY